MITHITRAFVRHYRDNGQITACVEWVDHRGSTGRTEGTASSRDFERQSFAVAEKNYHLGSHMAALFSRAIRDGLTIEHEIW